MNLLCQQITKILDDFKTVPDQMKTRLAQLLSTGFSDWSSNEYSRFIKAFKKLDLGDIEGIALEVETKSHDEV